MMRNDRLFSIEWVPLTFVWLFLAAFGVEAQSAGSLGPASGQIILITPKEPRGSLKIVRAKGAEPVNATEKMLVRKGYLLDLAPMARAIVLCGDNNPRNLEPGLQPCPCAAPCSPDVCGIHYDGAWIRPTRGGTDTDNSSYPVVVSPRATLLLSTRPAIRWTPITGSGESINYKVTLYGENMKIIWSRNVESGTELPYPAGQAPLDRGRTYKVIITAEGLSSAAERLPGLGFATLTEDQAQALAREENRRKQLEVPDPQKRFLISTLYAARELYAEAIERLEIQYNTNKESAVARLLGDLYAEIGLNREAEKKYLDALSLNPESDLDGLALTQRALAQVYENLGILKQAVEKLIEAIATYQRLGDTATVNVLLDEKRRLAKHGGEQ
ncbi:MAG TPA: tetratricopeptide repeat protein [Blastocatellia bacterium]|nr:tetratricopeptide repeat protein [Blastocatellia bacterium]